MDCGKWSSVRLDPSFTRIFTLDSIRLPMLQRKILVKKESKTVQKLREVGYVGLYLYGVIYDAQPKLSYCLVILVESSLGGCEALDSVRNNSATFPETIAP